MSRLAPLVGLLLLALLAPALAGPGLRPGDVVPDFVLADQSNKAVHLADYRGKAVILTFFYRTCPDAAMCPRLMSRLKEAWKIARQGSDSSRLRVVAITMDPKRDTPAALAAYAKTQKLSAPDWRFLTGPTPVIRDIATRFGVTFFNDRKGAIGHNMGTAVIDRQGRLVKVFGGSDWTPADVAAVAAKAAAAGQ